ncbi:MAG TPA: Ig-like domain repeat protein [Bryobacteraceae bacterium]|nr:Ig-like domain repeat protein [Bryobacteraceae bacterium]
MGWPITTPRGTWNNIQVALLDNSGTSISSGHVYLLTQPYTGTPAGLSSEVTGFVAISTGVSSGYYVFDPGVTLQPNTTYYIYTDTSLASIADDTTPATHILYSNNSTTSYTSVGGIPNYRILGTAVYSPPGFSQSFGAGSIPLNGSTTLSFTITNRNSGTGLTGVAFTDSLPAGLIVSSPSNGLTGSCGSGTISAVAGSGTISLSGGTIPASGSCTFSVNVTATAIATMTNTTSAIASNEAGDGSTSSASLMATALDQTITFGALPNMTYGAAAFALSASASSSLAVSFVSTTNSVCTVSGSIVTIIAAGPCSITASQSGNATYNAAPNVPQGFTVSKAALTVTANPAAITYGSATPVFTAGITGFVNSDPPSVVGGAPGFSTNATLTNGNPNAGSWTITPAVGTLSATNYSFTTFNAGTLTVGKATLTVTANNTSKMFGAVLPALTSTITGFVNGDAAAVVTGAAALSTTAIASSPLGSYPITAAAGTLSAANYGFGFANGALTITKAASATVLVTSGNLLTATVTAVPPGVETPTGTVQFLKGTTVLGTVPLSGNTATLPGSAGTVVAVYSGDENFTGSTSGSATIYPPAADSLSLTSSLNPSALGQAVTFTATFSTSGGAPDTAAPTGTVQFFDGAKLLGNGNISDGRVAFTTAALTGGSHTISARYSGDSTWPSASTTYGQAVNSPVTLTLIASPDAPVYGQTITLTAQVSGSIPPGVAAPTGQVTFSLAGFNPLSPGTVLSSAALTSGTAAVTVSNLPVGTQTITAEYSGDGTWSSMTRSTSITVSAASSNATVSLSMVSGQLTLASTVTPLAPATGTPTGSVQFVDATNNTVVATANLSGSKASTPITASAVSTVAGQAIEAVYSGDANFKSSTSTPLPAAVNAASDLSASFAADEIASLFGVTGLKSDTTATLPLTTSLGGVTVTITDSNGTDRLAPLYGVFGSAGQINFLVPGGTAPGLASVTITLPTGDAIKTMINVTPTAPGIFTATQTGQGPFAGQIVYVHPDQSQTVVNSVTPDSTGTLVPNPITVSKPGDQVYLTLYGTGLRHAGTLTATIHGVSVPVSYFGAQGTYDGLDQINIGPLPATLAGAGVVNLVVSADGQAANAVSVATQ